MKNRKLEKFEVLQKDKQVQHKHKSKKYKKAFMKYNLTTRTFDKADSIFNKWLSQNSNRFNTKLIKKSSWEFYFEGVIENVSLFVNSMPEAGVSFEYFEKDNPHGDSFFDIEYIEYIGLESYHPQKGYYDADRVDNVFKYFPSREELYINEVYETLISYCNKKIVPENSLYLFDFNGGTSAFIGLSDETDESDKRVHNEFENTEVLDDISIEERLKLFKEDKAYKITKYELFGDGTPLIRYVRREPKND